MDRIRTEYDQSKILEKNENLRGGISSKDLITKMLSESLSQITNLFNEPNSIRWTGSIEKIVDREKFKFSLKSFIQPKKTVKASKNNGLADSANCNIFSPNRYENLEADDTNSNTTIDITNTDYNRETTNNHMAKNKFNQNHENIVHRRKQVAVNQHPENQTVFNRLPVVPGKSSYKDTVDRKKEIFQFSVIAYQRGSVEGIQ